MRLNFNGQSLVVIVVKYDFVLVTVVELGRGKSFVA